MHLEVPDERYHSTDPFTCVYSSMDDNSWLAAFTSTSIEMNSGDRSASDRVASSHNLWVGWVRCHKILQELKMICVWVVWVEPCEVCTSGYPEFGSVHAWYIGLEAQRLTSIHSHVPFFCDWYAQIFMHDFGLHGWGHLFECGQLVSRNDEVNMAVRNWKSMGHSFPSLQTQCLNHVQERSNILAHRYSHSFRAVITDFGKNTIEQQKKGVKWRLHREGWIDGRRWFQKLGRDNKNNLWFSCHDAKNFFPSQVASDSGQQTFGPAEKLNHVTEVHSPSINGGSSGCRMP